MRIIALIQARSSSKRLPFKAMLSIANLPSIVFLYKRVIFPKKYKTTVLVSNKVSDELLATVLKKNKINFYRGDLSNVKKRFLDFLKKYKNNDIVIRLTADNLFVDKFLINKVIKYFLNSKKNYIYLNSKYSHLPYGVSVEIFKLSLLRKNKSFSLHHKEHVTSDFDKSRGNAMIFNDVNKKWKILNCSIDYLSDYKKIKNFFGSLKSPLKTRWDFLCNKLQYFKFKKIKNIDKFSNISLKSFKKNNLSKKLIKDICILKDEIWKFGIRSQLNFFHNVTGKNDIHNLLFLKKELIGYTLLRINNKDLKFLGKKQKFILLDAFIIKKKYRKLQFGEMLMHYNNNKILSLNLPAFLMCKKKLIKFYEKIFWKICNLNNITYLNKNLKKHLLYFNL
jgi:spore coat polysaccharide biosynthesis protein SpsF